MSLRIAIIGCTLSTQRCAEAIQNTEHEIVGIFTLDSAQSEAKSRYCDLSSFGEVVHEISDVKDPSVVSLLEEMKPDLLLEVGWSQRIPKAVLETPRLGTIGIHNSMLPKNQGAASINWALIKDEKEWGVTLFFLEEHIDEGDIIAQRSYPITDEDDINSLFDTADALSAEMILEALPQFESDSVPRTAQSPDEVTKLPRRKPEDGRINWAAPAREIFNLIRALKKPYPPAFTSLNGQKVLICDAKPDSASSGSPGVIQSVSDDAVVIGALDTSIAVLHLQREGEEECSAPEFATQHGLKPGDRFGT